MRFFDRYAGIPVVLFLSLFKRSDKIRETIINNILVVKIGTIGDTLLLVPVLKAIKNAYPKASLTVVGSKNNYEVLNRYPFIDILKIFEVSKAIKKPDYFFEFIKGINDRKYDVIMDFEPWPRISALLAFFVKTGYKMGFKTKGQFRHRLFDSAILHSPTHHEIDNYISLANAIGVSVSSKCIEFPIADSDKLFVDDLLKMEGIPYDNLILFHPWSSGYKGHLKEWGINNFVRLAKLLTEEGYLIGITGTRDNQPASENILKDCPEHVISFCGRFTLGQTASLIQKSLLLITVNTGIMHLGAMLKSPMIALHGPAGVLRWGPVGSSNAYTMESDFDCAPCLNLGFEYKCKDGGCMDAIKVEAVADKACEILNHKDRRTLLHS